MAAPADAGETPDDAVDSTTPDAALGEDAQAPAEDAAPVDEDAAPPAEDGGVVPEVLRTCDLEAFEPCGGDLTGEWRLVDFCSPEGSAAMPRECEGPGEDEPACQGGLNERTCALQYGGTATFGAQLTARFSVAFSVRYVLDSPCLEALTPGVAAEESCAELGNERLHCDFSEGVCRCEAQGDPESDENTAAYSVDGDVIDVRGALGRYCVSGDDAAIVFDQFGPEGWAAWLLTR